MYNFDIKDLKKFSNKDHANIKKYQSNNPLQKFLILNFYNKLCTLAKESNAKRIIDVGCGEGFVLHMLKSKGIGSVLIGIDKSAESIRISNSLFSGINIKKGDIYDLHFKDNEFDLVVCTEVLEHLSNPTLALKELKRITKKDLILSVPNEPFFMLSNLLRGKNLTRFGNDPEHINHWNVLSFSKFLKKHGLKIKTSSLPFPWILILCKK